jgi:2-oxoglutarate dehydrogenase E1 component
MSEGCFKEIIDDSTASAKDIDTVVFCSGKFYYDLIETYENIDAKNIAFVRMEQVYPFPENQLKKIIKKYGDDCQFIWAQEEPENMGPWSFILRKWKFSSIICCARNESGSPASGSPKVHERRHNAIINQVMSYAKQ